MAPNVTQSLILSDLRDIPALGADTIIDVRAPVEFALDHIPGAINLPVLDNDQRAEVGTIYTQVDRFEARRRGAALVVRNTAAHLEGALAGKPGGWRPLVYCWRGGQRSGAFASILAQIGWRVQLVEGGYRSYRRLVVAAVHDRPLAHRFVLLDGLTGTAKTEVLGLLAARGVQTLDLEGMAQHRGSVFGGLAVPQPSQKTFESRIALALAGLDPARPVVVEAESSKIGNLLVPPSVWAAMRTAPRIALDAPLERRGDYLLGAYADLMADRARLASIIETLVPLQGHARIQEWLDMVRRGEDHALMVGLMQHHYDPRYRRSRGTPMGPVIALPDLSAAQLDRAAAQVEGLLAQVLRP